MSASQPAGQSAAMQQRVDPVTASIIQGALENIAIEMGYKLMRMAYSSIIRESEDFGAALCDPQGRQLCECSKSTPLQSGQRLDLGDEIELSIADYIWITPAN